MFPAQEQAYGMDDSDRLVHTPLASDSFEWMVFASCKQVGANYSLGVGRRPNGSMALGLPGLVGMC